MPRVADTVTTLGAQFASALAAKDFDGLRELLHPEIDFRGMTPGRFWEASDPDTVVDEILQQWFEPSDEIDSLDALETDEIADRQRVGYRFSVHNPDGRYTVEQQAYLSERDGRIGWMRVMCTGFRPLEES
jgi:hypothetical protein